MKTQPILALELLGPVLTPGRGGLWDSKVQPEARRMLRELGGSVSILIHTTLISDDHDHLDPGDQATRVEKYLRAVDIPYDWTWSRSGKPTADYYVETLDDLKDVHREVLSQMRDVEAPEGIHKDPGVVPRLPEECGASAAGNVSP